MWGIKSRDQKQLEKAEREERHAASLKSIASHGFVGGRLGITPKLWDEKILVIGNKPSRLIMGLPVVAYSWLMDFGPGNPFSFNDAVDLLLYEGVINDRSLARRVVDSMIGYDYLFVV